MIKKEEKENDRRFKSSHLKKLTVNFCRYKNG